MRSVVIVGASLAGLRAAETLRTAGYDGAITMVGSEAHLPYDRPPLSKKVLAGALEPDRIQLRKADEYHDLSLDMRLGVTATALDPTARTVTVEGLLGRRELLSFEGLIIATGAVPRRLPGQPDLDGLFVLRTLDDSLALRAALAARPTRVVVVGAGFIGAEVAATARSYRVDVTLVEALPVPLARGLGEKLGGVFAELHRAHGVDVRLSTGVDGFVGEERVEGVRLSDGSVVAAEVVVVGIGVMPATGWLASSGLRLRDGVVCDGTLNVGVPGIYAAGDLARWPNVLFDEEMRVEHWTNAAEQGAAAAANLLATAAGGEGTAYAPVPFFWSDQYDARIQFLGRASADDEIAVVHGSLESRQFVALYGRGGRLRGALGVNEPRRVMPYRKLLAAAITWEDALTYAASSEG